MDTAQGPLLVSSPPTAVSGLDKTLPQLSLASIKENIFKKNNT